MTFHHLKHILTFTLIILYHIVAGQDETRQILTRAIHQECELIFLKDIKVCIEKPASVIKDKFNAAEIYLKAQLTTMVLVDSSMFYKRKKQELDSLENFKPTNKNDSIMWINKLEKEYLLVSVLKPSESDSLYIKLIYNYFQKSSPYFVDSQKLESLFYYKLWLYDLLESRFKKETSTYSKQKSILYYNKASKLSTKPFIDIDREIILLRRLEEDVRKATNNRSLNYTYEDLMSRIYEIRASKMSTKYNVNRSDSLFQFIESVYSKALSLTPEDYSINYNFGVFYYNTSVDFIDRLDKKEKTKITKKNLDRIEDLMKKSVPLLNKAKKVNENR